MKDDTLVRLFDEIYPTHNRVEEKNLIIFQKTSADLRVSDTITKVEGYFLEIKKGHVNLENITIEVAGTKNF